MEVTWSTIPPKRSRISPENVMTKPAGLSEEAKAAVTEGDLWSLFFTEEILDEIVTWTNQKIEDRCRQKNYSVATLKKSPHICLTDKVNDLYLL
jgi:hypothetical protein